MALGFMGTVPGLLVVENVQGELQKAAAWFAGCKEIADPDIGAILPEPLWGGTFVDRVAEERCRIMLRRPGRATLFIGKPDDSAYVPSFNPEPPPYDEDEPIINNSTEQFGWIGTPFEEYGDGFEVITKW
jgi:hypothetical protein